MPYALRLPNTGGYPMTPHRVFDDEPGVSRALVVNITPGELVPLEERGIALEDARKWVANLGCPLELVQIDKEGNEVPPTSGLTKAQLIEQAAKLAPPIELHDSQTKEQMLEAINGHVPTGDGQGADVDGNTAGDDTQDGKD